MVRKVFFRAFLLVQDNINNSSEKLKVIYIRHLLFYAIINYRFKISELKNVEKLLEKTVEALKFC